MGQNRTLARLDATTQTLVEDIVTTLAHEHEPLLKGVILFGSVAREEERALTDAAPSDVDLLAIFTTDQVLKLPMMRDVVRLIGAAHRRHLMAPREVDVVLAGPTMLGWDGEFIEQVARDGIVLYGQVPLLDVHT